MKKIYVPLICLAVGFTILFNSCKKGPNEPVTPNLIVGYWEIHHVYVRYYQNNVLVKDSSFTNLPQPNYISFNSNGSLEYRYNEPVAKSGTYQLKGADSVYAQIGGVEYKWKIDLLISTNLNVETTKQNYPGQGFRLETYQSFVK